MPFAAKWMELEITIVSEVSQKDKYPMISLICGIWNMTQMNRTETDSQTWRTDLWLPRGRGLAEGWSGRLGLADLSYYNWIALLYSRNEHIINQLYFNLKNVSYVSWWPHFTCNIFLCYGHGHHRMSIINLGGSSLVV